MQISCGASAVLFYLKFFIAIIFLKVKHKGKPAQRNVPSLPLTGPGQSANIVSYWIN